MTVSEFRKNSLVIDAVIRNFEIIGESSVHVPLAFQKENPTLPWKQMKAIRNVLIHEYFGVDVGTVWQTVLMRLPELKQQLLKIAVK
jgi:uncharacterized protein with HEPN domain